MGSQNILALVLILFINLGTVLVSIACPTCPPSVMTPPPVPKHSPNVPKHPSIHPPPTGHPPIFPHPPTHPKPPPHTTPLTPSSPPPKAKNTCPIDTLKLGACVDVLGGLLNVVIGRSAKDTCCPLLEGLVDLDAALCLCTTIRAKVLNVNILVPLALQVLVDCGKNPPSGFQCPA